VRCCGRRNDVGARSIRAPIVLFKGDDSSCRTVLVSSDGDEKPYAVRTALGSSRLIQGASYFRHTFRSSCACKCSLHAVGGFVDRYSGVGWADTAERRQWESVVAGSHGVGGGDGMGADGQQHHIGMERFEWELPWDNEHAAAGDSDDEQTTPQPIQFWTNNTERMRITATGNVGIGTAAPSERLQVNDGNVAITNTDNTARQLRLYEPSGAGTNFTAFRAQAQTSDITYTLPASAPATSAAWLQSDNTGAMSWRPVFYGTVSVDPPNINANTSATFTVTITGVETGDLVFLTPPSTLEGELIFQGANVTAANTVTIRMRNVTGAGVDGASLDWSYMVIRP